MSERLSLFFLPFSYFSLLSAMESEVPRDISVDNFAGDQATLEGLPFGLPDFRPFPRFVCLFVSLFIYLFISAGSAVKCVASGKLKTAQSRNYSLVSAANINSPLRNLRPSRLTLKSRMIPENKPAREALAIPLSSRGNARGVIPSLRSFVLVPIRSSFKAKGHLGDPSSAVLSAGAGLHGDLAKLKATGLHARLRLVARR
jgi:hypothetical protein